VVPRNCWRYPCDSWWRRNLLHPVLLVAVLLGVGHGDGGVDGGLLVITADS
jgi:hypothetical protein